MSPIPDEVDHQGNLLKFSSDVFCYASSLKSHLLIHRSGLSRMSMSLVLDQFIHIHNNCVTKAFQISFPDPLVARRTRIICSNVQIVNYGFQFLFATFLEDIFL